MSTKKRKNVRKKEPKLSLSRYVGSRSFFLTCAFLILGIWPLVHLFLMNEIKETQYRVEAIHKNITRLQQSILEIDSEIARLSRADRIKYIAVHELNMVDSQPTIEVIEIEVEE
ncbi:MAG: hypothetical protein PHS99_09335 [Candidatus Marinimicrobia bacterium]|nr:hypothetical protein [Candidatus Neomarinimicrobiota bacterium]